MGKRSSALKGHVHVMGTECAFHAAEGCVNVPQYTFWGPVEGPQGKRPLRQAGFIATAFVCSEHVVEAMEWMPRAEIIPFSEIRPALIAGWQEAIAGQCFPEIAFVP